MSDLPRSDRFNWLAPAVALLAVVVGGWVVWFAFNSVRAAVLFVVVGQGVAGLLLFLGDAIRSHRRAQSLRAELPDVARGLGLAYEEGEIEMILWEGPNKPLWQTWGGCQNLLSGRSDGVPAQMFDLTTTSGGGGEDLPVDRRWTAVLFQQTRLPVFACIPRNWSTVGDRRLMSSVNLDPEVGDQMTRQSMASFERAYELGVPKTAVRSDEDEVRRLFRAPRLEALARCPGWYVQSADGCLLLARSGTAPATDRPALWHEAIEIRRALLAPVSSAVMPNPVAPGMERDRQSNRQSGRSWGRFTGAVVGFFGSFIAFMGFVFSRRPAAGGFLFAGIPVVLGGVALGAFAGSRLGGRLADRSYRPTPEGAPAPTIGIGDAFGWVGAGAFAGWGLGAAITMRLAMTLMRRPETRWWMPIVCFSPAVLCLFLGGFAGYSVARRRADRRK